MKLKTIFVAINFAVCCLWSLTSQCVVSSTVAGNGSQAPNSAIVGKIYQPDGKGPARGDTVVIRPYDYLADIQKFSKRSNGDTSLVHITRTDDSGRFWFSSIPKGSYCLEAHYCRYHVFVEVDTSLFQSEIIVLPPETLTASVNVWGKLVSGYDSSEAFVRVYGLDAAAKVGPDSMFKLDNMPAGKLRLDVSIRIGEKTSLDTVANVEVAAGVDTLLSLSITVPKTIGNAITFHKTLCSDCYGTCTQQTADGGYIITGYNRPAFDTGSLFTAYLIKTDAAGETTWMRTLAYGMGNAVQQTRDGGYIILGSVYWAAVDKDSLWLIKTDAAGTIVWTRMFDGVGYNEGKSVQQTRDGGYVIVGGTQYYGADNDNVYLIKTDAAGTIVWTRTFSGDGYASGNSVQQTLEGGYVIVGETGTYGARTKNVYLIKTDEAGTAVWTKTIGAGEDYGSSIQQTNDGGYIIVGESAGNSSLTKTDSMGTTEWTKLLDGGTNVLEGHWGQQTNDGGYIVLGEAWHNLYGVWEAVSLIKTDATGNVTWFKFLGGADGTYYGQSMQQTSDGGYIITGFINDNNICKTFLIKTDENGDVK